MKKSIVVLIILSLFLFTGCSFTFKDPVDLIKPPNPGGELSGLKEAVQESISKNIILKTPKSGQYRSAYTLFDLDNNGENEAIVFYKVDSNTSGLRMGILRQSNGKWIFVKEFTEIGHDINEVIFADLNNSGKNQIITKTDSSESADDTFSLFCYENEDVLHVFSRSYTLLELVDMDLDGILEVLFLNHNINAHTSVASLFKLSDVNKISLLGSTELDGSINSYSSAKIDNKGYVYLDSIESSDNNMMTEVLVYESDRLTSPFSPTEKSIGMVSLTYRKSMVSSMDINDDGIIEIPTTKYMAGPRKQDVSEMNLLTVWNQISFDEMGQPMLIPLLSGALNISDSYMFTFPENWIDNITLKMDSNERLWEFYVWDSVNDAMGEKILGIITMTKSQWDKQELDGYSLLKEKGTTVYAVKYYEYSDYTLSLEQLEDNLIILN